jgi:hypothetical protein
MVAPSFRLRRNARQWLGLVLIAAPPLYACATGGSGEVPDGGGGMGDVGGDGNNHKRDGGPDSVAPEAGGGCTDSSQCCTAAQCPPTPHVATTTCQGGSCAISTCATGWYDFDASYKAGCNCQVSTNGTNCATATVVPPLDLGSSMTLSGNLPTEDGENWFQVTFAGAATNKAYHPEITLTMNPENEFVFDVVATCSGPPLSCADLPEAGAVTTWEEFYKSADAGTVASEFKPIAPVGNAGEVFVRVRRSDPTRSDCNGYELTVSD